MSFESYSVVGFWGEGYVCLLALGNADFLQMSNYYLRLICLAVWLILYWVFFFSFMCFFLFFSFISLSFFSIISSCYWARRIPDNFYQHVQKTGPSQRLHRLYRAFQGKEIRMVQIVNSADKN